MTATPPSLMSLEEIAEQMVKTVYPLHDTPYVTDWVKQDAAEHRDVFEACLRQAVHNERMICAAIARDAGADEVRQLILERNEYGKNLGGLE